MTTLDITNPSDALAASKATRESVRALKPSDPERVQALGASLGALKDTWTDELETHCRRGPLGEKRTTNTDDPVRVLARERRAEMKRLRSMLKPTSGTPSPSAPMIRDEQMHGHCARAAQVLQDIDAAHDVARRRFRGGSITGTKGGGVFMSNRELHAEARRLLDRLIRERLRLRTAFGRLRVSGNGERWDYYADWVAVLRADADRIAADLRKTLAQKLPERRKEDPTWTRDRCLRALDAYQREHGRLPTARQCNSTSALPAYTILTRKLGSSPLREATRLLRLADAARAS